MQVDFDVDRDFVRVKIGGEFAACIAANAVR
jgi:hypothetical protein